MPSEHQQHTHVLLLVVSILSIHNSFYLINKLYLVYMFSSKITYVQKLYTIARDQCVFKWIIVYRFFFIFERFNKGIIHVRHKKSIMFYTFVIVLIQLYIIVLKTEHINFKFYHQDALKSLLCGSASSIYCMQTHVP